MSFFTHSFDSSLRHLESDSPAGQGREGPLTELPRNNKLYNSGLVLLWPSLVKISIIWKTDIMLPSSNCHEKWGLLCYGCFVFFTNSEPAVWHHAVESPLLKGQPSPLPMFYHLQDRQAELNQGFQGRRNWDWYLSFCLAQVWPTGVWPWLDITSHFCLDMAEMSTPAVTDSQILNTLINNISRRKKKSQKEVNIFRIKMESTVSIRTKNK